MQEIACLEIQFGACSVLPTNDKGSLGRGVRARCDILKELCKSDEEVNIRIKMQNQKQKPKTVM